MQFSLFKSIKYLFPLFAVLITLLALSSTFISPPTWAEVVLKKYNYSFKILISISAHSRTNGEHEYQSSSRTYLLLPNFKTLEITRHCHNHQKPEGNCDVNPEVTVEESTLGAFYALLSYLVFWAGTWWYWRPKSSHT